jgi:hypothetical protein
MANTYKATGVNNLDLHVETETYYARIKKNGNTIRHAVGCDRRVAIKLKNEWVEEQRGKNSRVEGTLGSLVEPYHLWLKQQLAFKEISERTEDYKKELVTAARNTWQDFDKKRVGKLVKADLIYGHLRKGHSHAEAKTMRFVDEKDKQAITDFAI